MISEANDGGGISASTHLARQLVYMGQPSRGEQGKVIRPFGTSLVSQICPAWGTHK